MEPVNRRNFMKSVAGAAAMSNTDFGKPMAGEAGAVFLSTWVHGKPANERAAEIFSGGGSLLDAVERGINVPENDPNVTSVGYGGLPNEAARSNSMPQLWMGHGTAPGPLPIFTTLRIQFLLPAWFWKKPGTLLSPARAPLDSLLKWVFIPSNY